MLYRTRPAQPPRLLLRIAVTATVSSVVAMVACFGETDGSSSDDGGTGVYGGSSGTSSGMPIGLIDTGTPGSSTGSSCGGFCNGSSGTSSGVPSGAFDAGGLIAFPDDASFEAAADATIDASDSASPEDASSDGAPE